MAGKTLALFAVCARRWELWIFVCSADEMPLVRLVWYLWLVYFWELKLTIVGREFAVSFWVGFFFCIIWLAWLFWFSLFGWEAKLSKASDVRRRNRFQMGYIFFLVGCCAMGLARVWTRGGSREKGKKLFMAAEFKAKPRAVFGERVVGGLWVVVNLTRRFRVCDVRNKAECIWICVKWLSPISRLAN